MHIPPVQHTCHSQGDTHCRENVQSFTGLEKSFHQGTPLMRLQSPREKLKWKRSWVSISCSHQDHLLPK